MRRLCVVCARGGSRGLPNKNIRNLAGLPLIVHTIKQAFATELFDAVAVSSDSAEILDTARSAGVALLIKRPDPLATDSSAKGPSVVHCVEVAEARLKTKFDTVVDLDVTSPLRETNDIVKAVVKLEDSGAPNLFSVCESHRSPYFNLVEINKDGEVRLVRSLPDKVKRRQDAPICYDMNASIYVWRRDALGTGEDNLFKMGTEVIVMPRERSIDIDSKLDFEIVEFLYSRARVETL